VVKKQRWRHRTGFTGSKTPSAVVLQWYFLNVSCNWGWVNDPPQVYLGFCATSKNYIHVFEGELFNGPHANLVRWFIYHKIQDGARKPEVVLFWRLWLYLNFEGYLSRLLCFPGRQSECHYCHLDHNSSWYHISRWRQKSTTTILNLRSSTCKHSKRYVQNWKCFRFVIAILKIDLQ